MKALSPARRKFLLVAAAILLLVGALFAVAGVRADAHAGGGVPTTATVRKVTRTVDPFRSSFETTATAEVVFDADGRPVTATIGSVGDGVAAGDALEIVYDPANPSAARAVEDVSPATQTFYFTAAGVALAAAAACAFLATRAA